MGGSLTVIQKFWCLACIVWLIFIFVTYQDHFHSSAWSALVIVFVGLFPIMAFLVSFARRKYRDSLQYRPRDQTGTLPMPILTQSMIAAGLIPPEPREPPHRNLMRNPSIDSLVTYVYQKDGRAEGNDCVVCLCQLQQGEWVAKLQLCSHYFHEKCIDPWLRQHKTCPICRSRVDDKATEEAVVWHIAAVVLFPCFF